MEAQINSLEAAANAAIARSKTASEPRRAFKGFGSWGNFMPRPEERLAAANEDLEFGAYDPAAGGDHTLQDNAIDLVTEAGVDLDDVLGVRDLERIARASRQGAAARRRAVEDTAPSAVNRIARHLNRNEKAHVVANEFRARPDLAKSEHKGQDSELVRAYLLIDAALA